LWEADEDDEEDEDSNFDIILEETVSTKIKPKLEKML
jgi:hypothetical protein